MFKFIKEVNEHKSSYDFLTGLEVISVWIRNTTLVGLVCALIFYAYLYASKNGYVSLAELIASILLLALIVVGVCLLLIALYKITIFIGRFTEYRKYKKRIE